MRPALVILAVLLASAALFVLRTTRSPELPEPVIVTAASEEPAESSEPEGSALPLAAVDEPESSAAPLASRGEASGPEFAGVTGPGIRWGKQVVLGRLVERVTGEPCAFFTVVLVPTGTRLQGTDLPESAQVTQVDTGGRFAFTELETPGPWDVYALSRALTECEPRLVSWRRIGFARARNPEDAGETEFYVYGGFSVVLTAPLPDGVAAEDLWLEARWDGDRAAAARPGDPCARRGFVRGLLDSEGRVVARLPHRPRVTPGGKAGLRVFSRDGRFGLGVVLPGELPSHGPLEIKEPLRPRASLRVQLEFEGESSESVTPADWAAAARAIEWKLLMGDPEREGLPKDLRTAPENRCWRSLGNGVFELRDLPAGALEVGRVFADDKSTPMRRGEIVMTNLRSAQATHAPAPPVSLKVRRVR